MYFFDLKSHDAIDFEMHEEILTILPHLFQKDASEFFAKCWTIALPYHTLGNEMKSGTGYDKKLDIS